MPAYIRQLGLDKSAGPIRRALHYASYDWTRDMPKSKRLVTMTGLLIQGYAIYALWGRSLIWPLTWPTGPLLYVTVWMLYVLGYCVINAMLTSEFLRKTQLESDEMAAQQIQRTLQPDKVEPLSGYQLETFYEPLRAVGGDYFDVIELPGGRTLFVLADVSGKGMPAALLASNIQALVRSIANTDANPLALAGQINKHLSRYTPSDRFATAVFIVLSRDSGELTYVNAGHNPPMICSSGSTALLEATGLPLGLFASARYEARIACIAPGGTLLLFTDGLTDSISGDIPQDRLRDAMAADPARSLSNLITLVDPKLNEDDIAILLLKRTANQAPPL